MFGKKDGEKEKRANEKLVRTVLGKDTQRPVFGFRCSPDIKASLKKQADSIHVPLFALAEHTLQLGAIQLLDANNNPEEREELRSHLTENHVEMNTIEKIARYDEAAAETLKIERIRRFNIDRATRELVVKYMRLGLKPEELEEMIQFGHRCRLAILRGWPCPPGVFSTDNNRRPDITPKKHDPDTPDNDTPA